MLGLDHQVGELAGHGINDHSAHRATGPVAAHRCSPDRERGVCHAVLLCRARPYRGAAVPLVTSWPPAPVITSPASRRPSGRPPRRHRPRRGTRGRPPSGRRARGAPALGRPREAGTSGANVRCSSEQNHTSAPSTDGSPWSIPSALSPQSATVQPGRHGDHGGEDGQRLGEGQPELAVGGVHERVGTGLDLGGPRVEVVGPGAARRDDLASDLPGGQDELRHGLLQQSGTRRPVLQADDVALVSHDPAHAEPGGAGPIGQPPRVLGPATASGEAHVDVDRAPRARRPAPQHRWSRRSRRRQ